MKRGTTTRQNKKAMLAALERSLGIVTTAAMSVGISRIVHYQWTYTDPEYKKAVEELQDMVLDFAESQLHKQIKEGNTTATIFYLKTKGKKRGFVERTEIVHDGSIGGFDSKISDESKKKIEDILENEY